ncbi:hypothetical protein V2J09_023535, partial [Rumex salicifolius]
HTKNPKLDFGFFQPLPEERDELFPRSVLEAISYSSAVEVCWLRSRVELLSLFRYHFLVNIASKFLYMDLESGKILESVSVPRNGEYSTSDGPVQFCKGSVQDNDNLGNFLNDFESYWQDINDRLIISRVVSDSVMKGIINAVSQEAAEMVSAKEIEVAGLKKQLSGYERVPANSQSCFGKKIQDKLKVVSSICEGLDSVQKSLLNAEKLSSHGSLEIDQFHCRVLMNHVSPWEAKSRLKEPSVILPESFESSHIKHMPINELYSYFREVITKLKRDHETTIQEITEDYFSLKREYLKERELLKERGSFLPLKSKDVDTLRKTIPDVILKLKDILSDYEDFSKTCDLSRDKMDNLLMENQHLRELLNQMKVEIECLSSQVSEVEERLSQHILDEACQFTMIGDLKKSLEDANIEASVREEDYKCRIRELASDIKRHDEENDFRFDIMQDTLKIVCKEAFLEAGAKMRLECGEFYNMQAITVQDFSGIIVREVLRDIEAQLKSFNKLCLQQDDIIDSLKSKASDMEKALACEAQEKDELKQKVADLEALIRINDILLIKEKDQSEKLLHEMKDLKAQLIQEQALIYQRNTEFGKVMAKLEESVQKIDLYEDQIDKLNKTLELVQLDSKSILEERDKICLLLDAKDREHREQMESAVYVIQDMTKAFESFELRTIESMKWNNVRLENSTFQLGLLVKKVNVLRRTGLLYKQRLDRRCSDLQKAEAEVDLLGDEVETLLGLLEKIYIALDHYELVLQHYPGVMEILRLVERKLSTQYAKSTCVTPYSTYKQGTKIGEYILKGLKNRVSASFSGW